jgi:hypothetical protein
MLNIELADRQDFPAPEKAGEWPQNLLSFFYSGVSPSKYSLGGESSK